MTRPPLELIVYPPAPEHPAPGEAITRMHPKYRAYQEYAEAERKVQIRHQQKRLTDAELAAEYWMFDMADFDYPAGDPDDITEEQWAALMKRQQEARAALHRFATLPHASENGYE